MYFKKVVNKRDHERGNSFPIFFPFYLQDNEQFRDLRKKYDEENQRHEKEILRFQQLVETSKKQKDSGGAAESFANFKQKFSGRKQSPSIT